MTDREYRAREGISRSELWRLNPETGGTPEKFLYAQEHPEEPTPALIFGRMVHKMLLEPESFGTEFAVAPECNRRTKDGKALYEAFLAGIGEGVQEISAADFALAGVMVRAARNAPFVGNLLAGDGETEVAFFWTDELTGEKCKIRLDRLRWINGVPIIVDYKSTTDASPEKFSRDCLKFGYYFQAAMYCEGVRICTGKEPRFLFIAQEKTAPFAVNIMEPDSLCLRYGYDQFRELMGIYHACRVSGNWYGYMGEDAAIGMLSLPAWAAK